MNVFFGPYFFLLPNIIEVGTNLYFHVFDILLRTYYTPDTLMVAQDTRKDAFVDLPPRWETDMKHIRNRPIV